jgi:hypothetical protein
LVPFRVPLPEASDTVTLMLAWLTGLPPASRTWITGAVPNTEPLATVAGGWVVMVR